MKTNHEVWGRVLGVAFLSIAYLLTTSGLLLAQDPTADDLEKLRRAKQAVDRFVDRYRETFDVRGVLKEFQSAKFVPMMRSLVMNDATPKAQREISDSLLEKGVVALLNYLYLKCTYDLSVAKIESNPSEEQFTPKSIKDEERANKYIKTNGKDPKSAKELKEYIAETEKMAKLYRKRVSRASFNTPAYTANILYLAAFYKPSEDKYRVVELEEEAGLGKGVKEYRVTRGPFHYAFIEVNGEMKLIGIGMGN